MQKYNSDKKVGYISLKAIEKLESYDYPGNFRELERVVRTSLMQAAFDGRDTIITDDITL